MHASSTTVSSSVFSYIIHAYFHLIYFFLLILSNALAGSRLLQSAPLSYPFCAPLGQSLCPGQKDPHDDFQILLQDTNIYGLQCERSHLFSSLCTCAFTSQSIFNRTQTILFICAILACAPGHQKSSRRKAGGNSATLGREKSRNIFINNIVTQSP